MSQKITLRRRITPSVPFIVRVESGEETFELSFRLCYDLNAFALVEDKTQVSMLTDFEKLFDRPSVTTTTILFWAALQENHSEYEGEYGLRAVRNLLSTTDLGPARSACFDAFVAQLPKERAEKVRARIAEIVAAAEKGEEPPAPEIPTPGPASPVSQ